MSGSLGSYGALFLAIVCEVCGTSALKASAEFTRLVPTVMTGVSYLCSFYFLAIAMRVIPVGIAYAVWSGVGIVLISLIGLLVFEQRLDLPAFVGLGLILAGVLVVNLFSKAVA